MKSMTKAGNKRLTEDLERLAKDKRIRDCAPEMLKFIKGQLLEHLYGANCDCYEKACRLIKRAEGKRDSA